MIIFIYNQFYNNCGCVQFFSASDVILFRLLLQTMTKIGAKNVDVQNNHRTNNRSNVYWIYYTRENFNVETRNLGEIGYIVLSKADTGYQSRSKRLRNVIICQFARQYIIVLRLINYSMYIERTLFLINGISLVVSECKIGHMTSTY